MGRTTTSNRGYSLPDLDAGANIPADLATLGNAVDADMGRLPYAMAAVTVPTTLSTTAVASASFTLPGGRFTVAPKCYASFAGGYDDSVRKITLHATATSTTTGTVYIATGDGSAMDGSTVSIDVLAVQMTPTTAAG